MSEPDRTAPRAPPPPPPPAPPESSDRQEFAAELVKWMLLLVALLVMVGIALLVWVTAVRNGILKPIRG